MGCDAEPDYLEMLAKLLHREHKELKVAWYSGRSRVPYYIDKTAFDYIKIGPYIRHLGCLSQPTTNQRLYKKAVGDSFTDITSRFWRK